MILSEKLAFEKLANTRDLGGMIARDGRRIRKGRLIRSGLLARASEKDLEKLSQMLSAVVDFRSDIERWQQPDPSVSGVEYFALPAVEDTAPGVTREAESDQLILHLMKDREKARAHMIKTYRDVMTSAYSLRQYERFFRLLLEGRDKAILWHCTAGKDRAGMAAFFVEKALGVPDEVLQADYLMTNQYLADEVQMLAKMLGQNGETDPVAVDYLFGAKTEYLDVVYQIVHDDYHGFDAFYREGLRLNDSDLEQLRALYLES